MQKYKVVWKGEIIGEFTLEELRDEVARAAIGPLHNVMLGSGKFVSVSDFLEKTNASKEEHLETETASDSLKEKNFEFTIFGYALAGLSFLSITSIIASVIYCFLLLKSGRKILATQIFILSIAIGFLGIFFKYLQSLL